MFDFKYDWNKALEVGIELIDLQHEEFFRIMRDIEQLLLQNRKQIEDKLLLNIICSLREFVSYHFYAEEVLMQQYKYSQYTKHKNAHRYMNKLVMSIDGKQLQQNPQLYLKQLKDDITIWVFEHMIVCDKHMADEILKKMEEEKGS